MEFFGVAHEDGLPLDIYVSDYCFSLAIFGMVHEQFFVMYLQVLIQIWMTKWNLELFKN
jgi:hypothetical protein